MAERVEQWRRYQQVMQAVAELIGNTREAAQWLLTVSEVGLGHAPAELLHGDPSDLERLAKYVQSLVRFELVVVRPGEMVALDVKGEAVFGLAGKPQFPLSDEQLLARALDRFTADGWLVVSSEPRHTPLSRYRVLARRKEQITP